MAVCNHCNRPTAPQAEAIVAWLRANTNEFGAAERIETRFLATPLPAQVQPAEQVGEEAAYCDICQSVVTEPCGRYCPHALPRPTKAKPDGEIVIKGGDVAEANLYAGPASAERKFEDGVYDFRVTAGALATPAQQPAPISRAEWIAEAKAIYLDAGDDEATATECARYLCNQQDWLGCEVGDPSEEVQCDLKERPLAIPVPAQQPVSADTARLRRYLSDALQEGSASERVIASTALKLLDAAMAQQAERP